ncbi:MAG: S23 ribosomal protein [Candidatus Kaiserbacteria bacterium GW2011_GWA2_49_19]|uniref:S23 ribosomal protein n=1 Tax=Candidatus Kaiserbacteria bacterium GW2011_GWA2_49_19 TaxID=1618669 RepID=A0A0G1VNF8_9BACT|nr:MAG: S23 ribosomal protein [Candidatus Kaiserbacteria bacterium GW2011_GWA2_49_19]
MTDTVGEELIKKTLRELEQAGKPQADSRSWKDPTGYRFLTAWSNSALLRILVRCLTNSFPKSEYRRKAQMDDAIRSVVRNIEEGFKRSTTGEYIQFIGYSQGSLEEVKGDIRDCGEDKFLTYQLGSSVSGLGIDLKAWNDWCRNPLNSSRFPEFKLRESKGVYRNLKDIKGSDLTYEIFMELINKTDWLLRRLVQSLENKQEDLKLRLGGMKR